MPNWFKVSFAVFCIVVLVAAAFVSKSTPVPQKPSDQAGAILWEWQHAEKEHTSAAGEMVNVLKNLQTISERKQLSVDGYRDAVKLAHGLIDSFLAVHAAFLPEISKAISESLQHFEAAYPYLYGKDGSKIYEIECRKAAEALSVLLQAPQK
jgi:hypothetical protein